LCLAQGEKIGADIPWTTYEAEKMNTNGAVIGPGYSPYKVETESSGQRAVKLSAKGNFVEFASTRSANSLVIRYSLPDAPNGDGISSVLAIYKNDKFFKEVKITSKYSWLYGKYPFSNSPVDAGLGIFMTNYG
jgi:hypothetical protein